MGFANMCVSEESETTMNGDEKHVGISDAYFHIYIYIYNKGKTIFGKENYKKL